MAGRQGSNSGGRGQSRALSRGLAVEPEPMVSLAFVKNDSYEKGPDAVVVHVYVKEIRREASRVLFREQDFTLVFQTRWAGRRGQTGGPRVGLCLTLSSRAGLCRDANFLRLHPGCGPHTVFRWQVKLRWVVPGPALCPPLPGLRLPGPSNRTAGPGPELTLSRRNLIEPEQCTFCFTAARIDICLRKRQSQRWGGLEAPAARGLPTSSLHCPRTRDPPLPRAANHRPSRSPFLRCSGWCKGCRADRPNPSGLDPSGRCSAPPDRPGGSPGCGEGEAQGSS